MGMFGARFAVFVRRARVLPTQCPATRNLSFLRFHRRRHPVVSTRCFTVLVRVGTKIPQAGNRANRYEHVVVVREHVWRTLCSVCATGARVAQPLLLVLFLCNTRNFRSLDLFMSVRDVVHFKTKNKVPGIFLYFYIIFYFYDL